MKTIDDIVLENDDWICEFIEENLCEIPIFRLLEYLNVDIKDIYPIYGYLDSDYPIAYSQVRSTIESSRLHVSLQIVNNDELKIVTDLENEKFINNPVTIKISESRKKIVESLITKYLKDEDKRGTTYLVIPDETGCGSMSSALLVKNVFTSETIKLNKLYSVTDDLIRNGLEAICSRYCIYVDSISFIKSIPPKIKSPIKTDGDQWSFYTYDNGSWDQHIYDKAGWDNWTYKSPPIWSCRDGILDYKYWK